MILEVFRAGGKPICAILETFAAVVSPVGAILEICGAALETTTVTPFSRHHSSN